MNYNIVFDICEAICWLTILALVINKHYHTAFILHTFSSQYGKAIIKLFHSWFFVCLFVLFWFLILVQVPRVGTSYLVTETNDSKTCEADFWWTLPSHSLYKIYQVHTKVLLVLAFTYQPCPHCCRNLRVMIAKLCVFIVADAFQMPATDLISYM